MDESHDQANNTPFGPKEEVAEPDLVADPVKKHTGAAGGDITLRSFNHDVIHATPRNTASSMSIIWS